MKWFPALSIIILLLSVTLPAGTLRAQEPDSTETAEEKILSLKKQGEFAEALDLANQHLAVLKGDPESKAHEITDAQLDAGTLARVLLYPDSVQKELADAWRMDVKMDSLYREGNYQETASKLQEQMDIFERYLGKESPEFSAAADFMGRLLYLQGDYKGAGQLFQTALDIRRKLFGDEHPKVAESINSVAVYYIGRKDYQEAEKLLKESLEMNIKLLGDEDLEISGVLHNLAHILHYQGKYDEAEQNERRSLEIRTKYLGEDDPKLITTRNSLANILLSSGKYRESEALYRKNLEICRRVLGDNHPDTALCLDNLSRFMSERDNLAEAEALMREAVAIRMEKLGKEHPETLLGVSELATILTKQGKYKEAEKMHREILSIQRGKYGDEHPEVASSLHGLAMALYQQGNYAEAEPLLRQSIELYRKNPKYERVRISSHMSDLAMILRHQGNYEESAELHREVLAMKREMFGEKHLRVAPSISILATSLGLLGEDVEAEQLYREALAMRREFIDEDDQRVAVTLANLAGFLWKRNRQDEAVALFEESLEILRRLHGDKHPAVAQLYKNLALVYSSVDDYSAAEKCWREALRIQRELMDITNPTLISTLTSFGGYHYLMGNFETAASMLAEAAEGYDTARMRTGGGISRAKISKSPYPWLAAAQLQLGEQTEAWLSLEKSFGRVLGDLLFAAGKRPLNSEEEREEDSLKEELAKSERELTVFKASSQSDSVAGAEDMTEIARGRLLSAQAAWNRFQLRMSEKYPVGEGHAYTRERIQKSLQQEEAILGWLDFSYKYQEKQHAWVYVIRNQGPVQWALLELTGGETGEVQRKFLNELEWPTQEISIEVKDIRQAISMERIWPAMSMLEGVKNLVVIPSGPMLGIPVEALADDQGVLLSDRFIISYIPSATIYAWLEEREGARPGSAGKKMLLVGDPPFCKAHLASMNQVPPEPEPLGADMMEVAAIRSVLSGNRDAISSMPRIPASREEIEAIADMSAQADVLAGPDASEQNLVRLAGSGELAEYNIIHIATHALVDNQNPDNSALILSQIDLPDPLEAAADGNRLYRGMVTVKDIIREWDLSADLVTLSACETGLGLEAIGEGYVGFMHAFLQAGARSLIVSLWKVDDRATALLMERFYRKYLGKDGRAMPKAAALQEAKNWLRTYTDEKGEKPYAHPAYWSGFILVGDRG